VAWPRFDTALALDERKEYVVQVNGKLRHRFHAAAGLDRAQLVAAAKGEPQVAALLHGKTIAKEVAIPGRLVNFVARDQLET
jgi:leucyl-tRNA synthetase